MKNTCRIVFLFLLLLPIYKSEAQRPYASHENWYLGFDFGMTRYFGDVSPRNNPFLANPLTEDFYKNRQLVVSLHFGKEIAPFWFLRFNASYAHAGAKNYSLNKQTKITHINEFTIINTFDIFGFFPNMKNEEKWDLNVFFGLGTFGFVSSLSELESGLELDTEPNSSYKGFSMCRYVLSIPFGIGASYRFDEKWKLNFSYLMHWTPTDRFDAWQNSRKKMEGYATLQLGIGFMIDFRPGYGNRSLRENYPLAKKSPNYQYQKWKLKNGNNPVNSRKKRKGKKYRYNNLNYKMRR